LWLECSGEIGQVERPEYGLPRYTLRARVRNSRRGSIRESVISGHQDFSHAVVRRASSADVHSLGIIGPAAYEAVYGYLWDDSAALARQLATFGAEAFAKLLERADARLWIAQVDASILGFLAMVVGSANPITREANGAEIPRIYLLPEAQRLGLGKQLLNSAIAQARDENLDHIWLDVMASAEHARAAYLKWGFSELGLRTFDKPVKPELADMMVLIKYLK
jgi:diamine N-acetyltransferase